MLRIGPRSIQTKLVITIGVTLMVTLSMAGIALILFDRQSARQQLMDDIVAVTEITSKRSSAAVAFRDQEALASNLNALRSHPRISMACIYLTSKPLLAEFHRHRKSHCPDLSNSERQQYFYDQGLQVQAPITLGNRTIGVLLIDANLTHLTDRLKKYTAVTLALLLGSGLLGFIFTQSLHRLITAPIQQLAQLARRVRTENDFGLRARKETDDETGELVTSFNSMLHHIQETRWQLEDAVEELRSQKQASEQKAFSETNRANDIRSFFAGASHDLKQPLNAMRLFLEALQQQSLDVSARQLTAKIAQANQNLSDLFASLLDAEKFEHRMRQLDLNAVDLGQLIQKLAQEFEPLAMDKALSLRVHRHPIIVHSDAAMLERIVRNLISNAIRYTQRGGILVALRQRHSMLLIDVWDTGCGIPADKIASIFDQYVQLNNPQHETQKGFGLGLSIVKRLCDALGYSIEVKSRPAKGTLFRVILPRQAAIASPLTDAVETVTDSDLLLKHQRVLVVDDDMLSLEALYNVLSPWVLDVSLAETIEEAVESIADYGFVPDLLLSDYQLKAASDGAKITGLDAMAAVHQALGRQIPTLIMSGDQSEATRSAIAAAGLVLLEKPIQPELLKQQIIALCFSKPCCS